MVETLRYLAKLPADLVIKVVDGSANFFRDRLLLNQFVEFIYNYWRSLQRFIVCDSAGDHFDQKPYHTLLRLARLCASTICSRVMPLVKLTAPS